MKHLTGLEVVKANDGEYHYGICNDMGEIVADLAGFTNAEEIAHRFVDAINTYDKVGAQRDALVGACKALLFHTVKGWPLPEWDDDHEIVLYVSIGDVRKARAALALVEASQ